MQAKASVKDRAAEVVERLRAEPVYWPVVGLGRTMFAAQGLDFHVQGAENIPDEGPAVILMNHTSYLDYTYAGFAALPKRRLVRFMCKASVFDHKVAGPLMRAMGHIPVDRQAGAASFRAALAALKDGELVGVFPEATISLSFEPKAFKSGAVRMAQMTGAPVIIVAMWGAQRVWTKGYKKRLGRTNTPIYISVSEPIHIERKANTDEASAQLQERMTQMVHALQAEYPPIPDAERHLVPARLGGAAPTRAEADAIDAARPELG